MCPQTRQIAALKLLAALFRLEAMKRRTTHNSIIRLPKWPWPGNCLFLRAAAYLCLAAISSIAAAIHPSLDQALTELKVPPPWLETVPLEVEPGTPWNKAWDRIEELLMTADPVDRRKAVKLAYVYQIQGQARDGLPAATYFLAGEITWALVEHQKLTNKNAVAWMRLASCYRHFGEHDRALVALDEALKQLADPPWRQYQEAQVCEARGDILADIMKKPIWEPVPSYPSAL
jgi:tetratricopeptide (TPR) repeat protein